MKTLFFAVFLLISTAVAQARAFVDSHFFEGCVPVVGQTSCEGKVALAADGGYGLPHFPGNISGNPQGMGHVAPQYKADALLSLGTGGAITLRLTERVIDLPGPDLRVFENPFFPLDLDGNVSKHHCFMDWAHVEVSQDGLRFARFPSTVDKSTGDHLTNPYRIFNLAGVFPVYANGTRDPFAAQAIDADGTRTLGAGPGGDDFDLSSLVEGPEWIQYVRIIDSGSPATHSASPTAGFDLDTVVGLH